MFGLDTESTSFEFKYIICNFKWAGLHPEQCRLKQNLGELAMMIYGSNNSSVHGLSLHFYYFFSSSCFIPVSFPGGAQSSSAHVAVECTLRAPGDAQRHLASSASLEQHRVPLTGAFPVAVYVEAFRSKFYFLLKIKPLGRLEGNPRKGQAGF